MVLAWFGYFYPEQSQLLTWATGQSDKQDKTQTCNDDNLIFHLFLKNWASRHVSYQFTIFKFNFLISFFKSKDKKK